MADIKLTQLSHGGGCGCKIAPAVLESILSTAREKMVFPQLLVGTETSDDAAVYRLNDAQAIVATTDFFMPVVDDPFDASDLATAVAAAIDGGQPATIEVEGGGAIISFRALPLCPRGETLGIAGKDRVVGGAGGQQHGRRRRCDEIDRL